jgi:hypothetical protein
MKVISTCIVLFFASIAFVYGQYKGKNAKIKFSLSFSTFNHAHRLFDGTTTFELTESAIKVKKTFLGDTKSKTIYSKSISRPAKILATINKITLDSLKDFYFNNCVLITSGTEYFFRLTIDSTKKSITAHHYYVKELDDIVNLINSCLPDKHRLKYLSKYTQQNCSL